MAVEPQTTADISTTINSKEATLPQEWIDWLYEKVGDGESLPDRVKPRSGFGHILPQLGKWNEDIVVFDADLAQSTYTKHFRYYEEDGEQIFKDRFYEMGIAEQSMMASAGGYANEGFIPYITSYAQFVSSRACDQARNTVDYTNLNVKLVASHAALSVGEDGPSHQSMEDLSNMCAMVNMTVIVPADVWDAARISAWAAEYEGPVYYRMPRCALPVVTEPDDTFVLGQPDLMREGGDITILAVGSLVDMALEAAERLSDDGIEARVYNYHTIKPVPKDFLLSEADDTGAMVVAEEHNVFGGVNSIVSRVLMRNDRRIPFRNVAIENQYLTSGPFQHLFEIAGLTPEHVYEEAKEALEQKAN